MGPLARASFDLHAELAERLDADYGYRRVDTLMVAGADEGSVARPWRTGAARAFPRVRLAGRQLHRARAHR